MSKVVETRKIPEWIRYPERYVSQREEMRAYTKMYDLCYGEYLVLIVFI